MNMKRTLASPAPAGAFDTTPMAVHVRMDGNGRIAAYRIDVPQNVAARK
jgi:hypothetical protein